MLKRQSLTAADSPADAAVLISCWIVVLATVVAPVLQGCTGAWSRLGLEAATTCAVVIWICARRPSRVMLMLPMSIAAAAIVQVVPIPDRVLEAIAPISASAWKVSHEGFPAAMGTVSIDPAVTATGARRMLLGLATIVMVTELAVVARFRGILAAAMAVSGVLVLTLAVIFPVSARDRVLLGCVDLKGPIVLWKSPDISPLQSTGVGEQQLVAVGGVRYQADEGIVGDGLGPYISSNQFANAICLTVPIIAAVWLTWSSQRVPSGARWVVVLVLLGVGIWASGILARSRAGGLAMVFAAAVFAALALPKSRAKQCAAMAAGAIGLFVVLAVFVFYGQWHGVEAFAPAGLRGFLAAALADPRIAASQVAMRMFAASPWLGTGLGTYGDLYQRFTGHAYVLYFAHNEYAQLLAETGLLGVSIAAWLVWVAGQRLRGFLAASASIAGPATALAAGAWAAVAGMAAHAFFDWNMHVPANGFLSSVGIGLALSTAPKKAGRTPMRYLCNEGGTVARLMFVITCLGCLVFLTRDAFSEWAQVELRRAITQERMQPAKPVDTPVGSALLNAIARGEATARWAPGDAHLALLLGQAHFRVATMPQPIDDANVHVKAAEYWVRRARQHCASLRGLPVPDRGQ